MACKECGESRYFDPVNGCLICNRKKKAPKFVITLTDEEFRTLSNRKKFLEELLVLPLGQFAKVIIQRAEKGV